jgi:co-chaperonin GroES (HSP10)
MKIIPIGNRYIIEVYKAAEETESGLVMDNTSNVSAAPIKGTILEVGDNARFAVGDVVYFRRYSIDQLKYITEQGEQEVSIIEAEDILAQEKVD